MNLDGHRETNHFTFCITNATITNKSASKGILGHSHRYCLLLGFDFLLVSMFRKSETT